MFERLTQRLLSNFLSKYFTEESLNKNKTHSSSQLGVWSGYVSLQELELKKDYINGKLRSMGQPFEIAHCSFRQIEITIPWAKLSNPIGSVSSSGKRSDDAVVVVVIDGAHVLVKTNFEFDDQALREEAVKRRRKQLSVSLSSGTSSDRQLSYTETVKKRLKEGLLQEIADKLHIHLRNLHVRLEDVQSDSSSPFACGITLESMHIQYDEDTVTRDGIVTKMAQLNHLAIYWNALDFGEGLPFENSVLHETCRNDATKLSNSLNFTIARRGSIIASPTRKPYVPTHTYLLLPVDGIMHASLSTNPTDLLQSPALKATLSIDPVHAQLRDFQCVQILRLANENKNHRFVRKYRKFRPQVPVKQEPRAWWRYAARVIRFQLRERFLRWSKNRFLEVLAIRKSYMELYRRKLQFPESAETSISNAKPVESSSASLSNDVETEVSGGPTNTLSREEALYLQDLEDGLKGDISVTTILFFRAIVHRRIGRVVTGSSAAKSSWWTPTIENAVVEDAEAQLEFEKLLEIWDNASMNDDTSEDNQSQMKAISLTIQFERLTLALHTPLVVTAGEDPVRQIHEKFLDFGLDDLRCTYVLMGDYKTKEYQISIVDMQGTETRIDKSQHVIAKRVSKESQVANDPTGRTVVAHDDPLLAGSLVLYPPKDSGQDVHFVTFVNTLEIELTPECDWITRVKGVIAAINKVPNVAEYWDHLTLAYFNSLSLGKLGLFTKAESAVNEHKNLQADVTIQCPVLRLGDGGGNHFIVDLGVAQFKTEKLAGVSQSDNGVGKLSGEDYNGENVSFDNRISDVDDASVIASISGRTWASRPRVETPTSGRWKSDRHFNFSSALSIDSRNQSAFGNRSFSGSLNLDEPLSRMRTVNDRKESETNGWHHLFYDIFSLRLQTGRVTFCGESEIFDVSTGFELSTILKKSVLPADHTLCKLKAHTDITSLHISLNEKIVGVAYDALMLWKDLLSTIQSVPSSRSSTVWDLSRRIDGLASSLHSDVAEEESLSNIDENEFFDTNEGNDSLVGDSSAVWFDDNWISDAESFIEGDSRSFQNDRLGRRRRAPSISDVSSASDQSTKESPRESKKGRISQQGNAYLSAENLARLEEGASEDNSVGDSAIEIDEDSFHSVMSEAEQKRLLRDLEDDIARVESEVQELNEKLYGRKTDTDKIVGSDRDLVVKERRSGKRKLNRLKAELNALRALQGDLLKLVFDLTTEGSMRSSTTVDINTQAKNARKLLEAKRERETMLESNGSHNLMKDLNRELFQGSFTLHHFQVTLHVPNEDPIEMSDQQTTRQRFVIIASQIGLAVYHHLNDSKVYVSADQIVAGIRGKVDALGPTEVLFSGGSTETLLPSHFPHLISRSMEEKFFRGAIHIGRRRLVDGTNQQTRSFKLRLMVGDIEIFPSKDMLGCLQRCVSPARGNNREGTRKAQEKRILNGIKGGHLGDMSSNYVDVALRLTSIRFVLGHQRRIVGAAAATETVIRLVHVASPVREKSQFDLKCTNLQILEISSLEAGRGSEIFGRRDPYSALIQIRARNQKVSPHESGGWVVGSEPTSIDISSPELSLWRNMHVGVKMNPVSIIALPRALSDLRDSFEEFRGCFSSGKKDININSSPGHTDVVPPDNLAPIEARVRWRMDISLKRVALKFADDRGDDWNFVDEVDSKMLAVFSAVCCVQQSSKRTESLSVQVALTEIAFLRSSDDWPVFEPFSLLCDTLLDLPLSLRRRLRASTSTSESSQLKLQAGSPLDEITAVMRRYSWDTTSLEHTSGVHFGIITKVTPIKANLSARIIDLVRDVATAIKGALWKKRKASVEEMTIPEKRGVEPQRWRTGLHCVLEEIELQVLKDTESRPIAHAKSLLSFAMADVRIDYEKGEQVAASVLIRNSSIFDYSSSRGIRILGQNQVSADESSPYFVRVKLYMDKHHDTPNTIRLDISWGRIQCLVLPSFLKSLLELQDDVRAILRPSLQNVPDERNTNVLQRFLATKDDVNLFLSAHADSFECIFSSKDIIEYVRASGSEPIGVVTFRWKASLNISLALDKLTGSSVPWLTLNLDGKFTDAEDTVLFRNFVNRYLSSSSGLLAGSDEIGHRLVDVFTARMGLFVKDFQVVRTNIRSTFVKPSSRNVSYESAHRLCFMVEPPIAGEQRVTNTIDIDIIHRLAGASMVDITHDGGLPRTEISQLLQVRAKFVDILLYISQSESGFTEAYKTSVKPLFEILRRKSKKESRRKTGDQDSHTPRVASESIPYKNKSIADLLRGSSSLCTIQFEGFQITCVPGGATRLNESPILKIELNNFAFGIAATPSPVQTKRTTDMGTRSRTSSQNLLRAADVEHLVMAGWIACELSGHYHNRRLVAWEPFLEPWYADLRFGIDTVDIFNMEPVTRFDAGELRSPVHGSSAHEPPTSDGITEARGDRLREFGRLFRAPFQNPSSKQTSSERLFISHADFCYLMLASTSRSTILSVLYPSSEPTTDQEDRLFSRLPAREKLDWLHSFGFPGRESDEMHSFSCTIGDSRPMNVNLTGALIENVLGYVHSAKSNGYRTPPVAPHWIRNDTGMTIRFQEVLDVERARRGEDSGKTVVMNGVEVPLTLKRSLSQTCDPHRAYILLELGSFEDTVGRIKQDEFDVPKGALASTYFFKAAAKIPVDTVGVHRYPLDRNGETRNDSNGITVDSRALGWIIVRVGLRDGVKIVSVESPFILKSTADTDLMCEVRDFNGLSLLWKCLVPRHDEGNSEGAQGGLVSVPADIVPFLHDSSYSFSVYALPKTKALHIDSELPSLENRNGTIVLPPAPFSPQSYGRGLLREEEVSMYVCSSEPEKETPERVHLTVGSIRIGSFSGMQTPLQVPEQRMIIFQASVAIRNCLALPIAVQVRLKHQAGTEKPGSGSGVPESDAAGWVHLGILECGQAVNWSGAKSTEKVQLRVRFVGTDGDNSRRFPGWSSPVHIPPRTRNRRESPRQATKNAHHFAQMRVLDAESIPLDLSVAFDPILETIEEGPTAQGNIRLFSEAFANGNRSVSIYVPYWIIDSSSQDLEFFSGASVAGQLDKMLHYDPKDDVSETRGVTLGLAELLDNANFLHQPVTRSFDVMMVGDESSTRLTVRKRLGRKSRKVLRRLTTPWSDPIPLQTKDSTQFDITVLSPKFEKEEKTSEADDDAYPFERLVLRSNISRAPEQFGGTLGTKLIHIVNRYSILNETGRDIEISSDLTTGSFVLVRATGVPQPFHFDDSRPIRFRFKEFGWTWSGKFGIRINRPEVTMRVRHKMKGQTVIITAELLGKTKGSTNVLVFRESSHPPFRLENHTMFPLHFGQSLARLGSEDFETDTMLLPYQSASFAWDEPEYRRRALVVKTTDTPGLPEGFVLGRFQLDKIAPGTDLNIESSQFTGEIVADGPTRVLRITDASMPSLSSTRQDALVDFQHRPSETRVPTISISLRLSEGIGVSVVDWSPQELLYIRLEDIQMEKKTDSRFDTMNLSVGNIKLNNQLWVTPYPVLLKMGRRTDSLHPIRRRQRRFDAIGISWRRSLDNHGGYGNLTLLDFVEVSLEPVFVNVDGRLASLLFKMGRQIAGVTVASERSPPLYSRDNQLREVLDLGGSASELEGNTLKERTPYQQGSDGDLMATAAVAAKLRAQPLPFVKVLSNAMRSYRHADHRKATSTDLSKPQHKFYIEKLRISATKADLSWSGPLPGLVSSLLLRAFTFERLPLRLRPFSTSHSYGSVKDHLQSVKSHYVSFWRIWDLFIGLSYNPTFLFRAVVYTSRETCASILDSWAAEGRKVAKDLQMFASRAPLLQPTYGDRTEITLPSEPKSVAFGRRIASPFARATASIVSSTSNAAIFISSLVKYRSQGSKRLTARGLRRSRNPRLFAHVDGKDLLVEYVEGENAGKALLSRVRMGTHLGEGYVFHSEGVRQRKLKPRHSGDLDPAPLIVMITSERVLLLNGKLDWNFCNVIWEAMFPNIIQLELIPANDLLVTNVCDEVIIWFLSDPAFSEGNGEDRNTHPHLNDSTGGVDVLDSVSIFVPSSTGAQLVKKMVEIDCRLQDDLQSSNPRIIHR